MIARKLATVAMSVVSLGACFASGCSVTDPAGAKDRGVAKARGGVHDDGVVDPLRVLSRDERERFLEENADGHMVIEWQPSAYDLAMAQFLADQAAGLPAVMPDPLDFPNVVVNPAPPPDPATIEDVPHTPPVPSGG